MTTVRISREYCPELVGEETPKKDFYLNGEAFFVEVGIPVPLPDDKAQVVNDWMDAQQRIIDSHKKK